jgi:5-methylcytosine-specific restriction enzyme subunit McrC
MIKFASKVFENDYIPIIENRPESCVETGGVTLAEAEAIEDLADVECLGINSGKWAKIDRKGRRIKLGQYVGLVTVGQLSFEILPKVERYGSKSSGAGEADLREMIALAEDFHYSSRSFDMQAGHDRKLLEYMAESFFRKLNGELNFGLRRSYQERRDCLPAVRGRLDLVALPLNYCRRPHALPCVYEEFTEDTVLNRIMKQAVTILVRHPDFHAFSPKVINLGLGLLDRMVHVGDSRYSYSEVSSVKPSRLESRYSDLVDFSKNIIRGNQPFVRTSEPGKVRPGFTMVWDMSTVYEAAIARKVEAYVKACYPGCRVVTQGRFDDDDDRTLGHSGYNSYLAHEADGKTGRFRLKPDIMIIGPDGAVLAVLDTKWKSYVPELDRRSKADGDDEEQNYKNVKKDDAYQMLAYATSKRKDGKASYPLVGLLYPSLQPASAEVLSFTNLDSPIHLAWVPVTESGLDGFNLDAILGRVLFTENKPESVGVVALKI